MPKANPRWLTAHIGSLSVINPLSASAPPTPSTEVFSLSPSDLPAKGAAGGVMPTKRLARGELPPDCVTFTGGDIIVARNLSHFGRGVFEKIHPEFGEEGFAAASEFHVIRASAGLSASYLLHFLRRPETRDLLSLSMTGLARRPYLTAVMLGGY